MAADRYTARIADRIVIVEDAAYADLLKSIVRFTVEGAVARSADRGAWEHDELRRNGLYAIEVARNGRAIWCDRDDFEKELAEARRERAEALFKAANELEPDFCNRLDADLRTCWRSAGYDAPSLVHEMRALFAELEADAGDRAADAQAGFVGEVVAAIGS